MMADKLNTKKHILLIDSDLSVSQMFTMLLKTRGYEVSVARTAEEAYKKLSVNTDIIILDLVIDDEDGFEVCRKLKEEEHTRQIPIIILSAKSLSEDIVEGLYLGADDYVTKPFDYEELIARMEAVMRRGSIFRNNQALSNEKVEIICELRKILDEELIIPFFQPIFKLDTFEVLGFEALSRPRSRSKLTNPELLFKASTSFNLNTRLHKTSSSISTVPSARPNFNIILISSSVTLGICFFPMNGLEIRITKRTKGLKIMTKIRSGLASNKESLTLCRSPIVLGIISDMTIILKVSIVETSPSH